MKTLVVSLLVVATVLFGGWVAEAQHSRIGENLMHERIVLPSSVPDKGRLVVTDYEALMEDDRASRTARRADRSRDPPT
jgi:hypothetical protein